MAASSDHTAVPAHDYPDQRRSKLRRIPGVPPGKPGVSRMSSPRFRSAVQSWAADMKDGPCWETEVRGRRRYEAETFIKTMPETMSKAAANRTTFTGSPRAAMPTRNEPTAPTPVHTV